MEQNITSKAANGAKTLSLLRQAEKLFSENFQVLKGYNSDYDYDLWSDTFYDSMATVRETVKKVLSEIIELEANKLS